MPLFHLTPNDIEAVRPESFSALGISRRGHLQRVLRNNLDVIATDCLLIAEEFGDWDQAWPQDRTNDGRRAKLQDVSFRFGGWRPARR
jgi:hypothetical protein